MGTSETRQILDRVEAETRQSRQGAVLELLRSLDSLEPLKQLFWSELNYERVNQALSLRGWAEAPAKAVAEEPIFFAAGGRDGAFRIIYTRLASDRLLLTQERSLVTKLLRDHPYALFIFSNSSQDQWHFLNVRYDEKGDKQRLFRRITVSPEDRLRTASERILQLDLGDPANPSALDVQQRHDEAFNVEAVTRQFYEEYKLLFDDFQQDLIRQTRDRAWAHNYALQLVNRTMFLYFIQRKRWLGDDTQFVRTFRQAYQQSSHPTFSLLLVGPVVVGLGYLPRLLKPGKQTARGVA